MTEETVEATQDPDMGEPRGAAVEGKRVAREPGIEAATSDCPVSRVDSTTFARCTTCANADEMDAGAGTLLCKKHDMRINAEADEIPDDCVDFEPRGKA